MQMSEAETLRKRWARKGNPPCEHPKLDKEYIEGWDTGDKVCTICGKNFSPHELVEFEKHKSQ